MSERKDRDRLVWGHWQNLNEKRRGADGVAPSGFPWHGRAWLHWRESDDSIGVEWALGAPRLGAGVRHDEDGIDVHAEFDCPTVICRLSPRRKKEDRKWPSL